MNIWRRIDLARDGLAADLALYGLSAAFAWYTASGSTLASHRAWGAVAVWGYLSAAGTVGLTLLFLRYGRLPMRAATTVLTWLAVAVVPLVSQAVQRAGGRVGRAQEEVLVVEDSATRLVDAGTPYLPREEIAALADPLLGYTPYQPGMALFGLPRALLGESWWTDGRVWFALVTAVVLTLAIMVTRDGTRERDALLVRAAQGATVLPLCALTLATGGDDLPVLVLCLLAFALAGRNRFGGAGVAIGAAAAVKLFAWPVALVLGVFAVTAKRLGRYGAGAAGLPLLALLPPALLDTSALVENVIAFPTGNGLVTSPAASPLPGYLIAQHVPGGRGLALALLLAAGLAIGWWLLRRPPTDAAAVASVCAVGLLAAMLLMPATRFGYLLYPVAFALWVPALRPGTVR